MCSAATRARCFARFPRVLRKPQQNSGSILWKAYRSSEASSDLSGEVDGIFGVISVVDSSDGAAIRRRDSRRVIDSEILRSKWRKAWFCHVRIVNDVVTMKHICAFTHLFFSKSIAFIQFLLDSILNTLQRFSRDLSINSSAELVFKSYITPRILAVLNNQAKQHFGNHYMSISEVLISLRPFHSHTTHKQPIRKFSQARSLGYRAHLMMK